MKHLEHFLFSCQCHDIDADKKKVYLLVQHNISVECPFFDKSFKKKLKQENKKKIDSSVWQYFRYRVSTNSIKKSCICFHSFVLASVVMVDCVINYKCAFFFDFDDSVKNSDFHYSKFKF